MSSTVDLASEPRSGECDSAERGVEVWPQQAQHQVVVVIEVAAVKAGEENDLYLVGRVGQVHTDLVLDPVGREPLLVQVPPPTSHLQVTLVNEPAVARRVAARPGSVGERRANRCTHRYTVTWSTSTPRSASSSSTSRYDSPNRSYHRTATVTTSGGNRNPAGRRPRMTPPVRQLSRWFPAAETLS